MLKRVATLGLILGCDLLIPSLAGASKDGSWKGSLDLEYVRSDPAYFKTEFGASIKVAQSSRSAALRTDWQWTLGGPIRGTYSDRQYEHPCATDATADSPDDDAFRIFKDETLSTRGSPYIVMPVTPELSGTESCEATYLPPDPDSGLDGTWYEPYTEEYRADEEFPWTPERPNPFDEYAPVPEMKLLPRLAPSGSMGPEHLRGGLLRWRGTQRTAETNQVVKWTYDLTFDPPDCDRAYSALLTKKKSLKPARARLVAALKNRRKTRTSRKRIKRTRAKFKRVKRGVARANKRLNSACQ
ncbi:MAG: hypothetical protein IPK93_00410 [Solirubrobacterales bacterium]|nr:hypothetical protein [Solirubrobacterales bacterium]